MAKDFDYAHAKEVTIEVDGRKFTGQYALRGRILTVMVVGYGQKSTQLGGLTEEGLARILLRELVNS